jgi:PEGA domain
MFLRHSVKALVLSILLLTAGCSSTDGIHNDLGQFLEPTSDHPISIDSDPSGATVYVMDERIGVTPLEISRKGIFPNTYPKEKESLYGMVTLKKAGCSDYTSTVTPEIAADGLNAHLDCGDLGHASSKLIKEVPRTSETIEQRLEQIKELLNKGLITEDEARKARERVLNDL